MSNAPIVNFTSVFRAVSATFANLPPNSRIVFVNQASGKPYGGTDPGGSSPVTIPAPADMPAGDYYLEARDSTGAYLARSVMFYVDTDA